MVDLAWSPPLVDEPSDFPCENSRNPFPPWCHHGARWSWAPTLLRVPWPSATWKWSLTPACRAAASGFSMNQPNEPHLESDIIIFSWYFWCIMSWYIPVLIMISPFFPGIFYGTSPFLTDLGEATGVDLRPQTSSVVPGHRLGLAERRRATPRPRGARAPRAAAALLGLDVGVWGDCLIHGHWITGDSNHVWMIMIHVWMCRMIWKYMYIYIYMENQLVLDPVVNLKLLPFPLIISQ